MPTGEGVFGDRLEPCLWRWNPRGVAETFGVPIGKDRGRVGDMARPGSAGASRRGSGGRRPSKGRTR